MGRKQRKPTFTRRDGALILHLPYSLVADLEDTMLPRLDREMDSGARALVVDFVHVEFANSAGMGVLVILLQRAKKHGVPVAFASISGQPRALFERLDYGRHAPLYETVEEALAHGGTERER